METDAIEKVLLLTLDIDDLSVKERCTMAAQYTALVARAAEADTIERRTAEACCRAMCRYCREDMPFDTEEVVPLDYEGGPSHKRVISNNETIYICCYTWLIRILFGLGTASVKLGEGEG